MADPIKEIKQIQPEKPNLKRVLDAFERQITKDINCCNIGIIESFDPEKQQAKIQFALKQVKNTNPDGTRIIVEHPALIEVPVMILYGGSSYLTFPIAPGDECLLFFNDRQIENWYLNGGVQTPSASWAHDLSDAFALVGIRNLQKSISNYLANGVRLAYNAQSKIDLSEDAIESLAELWTHNGNMLITGGLEIGGQVTGTGGSISIDSDIIQESGNVLEAGNGATGTFNTVTVVKGIVVSGT